MYLENMYIGKFYSHLTSNYCGGQYGGILKLYGALTTSLLELHIRCGKTTSETIS